MKIIYFYQYFSTPQGAWGTRVYEFAKDWVAKGHEVTIITAIYSKSDIKATKFIEDQYFDGIHVKVINIKIDNKQSRLKRIMTWIGYTCVASWYALFLPADIAIASSGPITVGVPGLIARYLRRKKFIFEVRDIWPQGAIEMGLLKNDILKRLAYWFEKRCYKAADCIVALSPGMVKNITDRVKVKRIVSVTNSANIEFFAEKSKYDIGIWKNRKYAIYTGNIGIVNNSEWLLNCARILKERCQSNIYLLLVGDGQLRKEIEKQVADEKLSNLIFMNLMPKINLVAYLQNAMVSLVPLKGTPILDTSSPNKFFESLAAGIPVIQNTQGWMKDYLAEYEVGYTINPDDAFALADLLVEIKESSFSMDEIGRKAKKLAAADFDKTVLAQRMLEVILD